MSHKHLIEQRRRQENAYKAMDDVIASDRRVLQIATFENVTTNKIEKRMKQVKLI